MRVLDRYVLKSFVGMFAGSLVTISFLFTVFSVLDSLTYLMGMEGASFFGIVRYYLLQLPQTIFMTAPVAALLSAMITLGLMNQRHELTALRAAGISLLRVAMPMVAAAAVISVLLFELGNTLVPVGNRYFLSAKQTIKGDTPDPGARIWYVSEGKGRPPVILRLEKIERETGRVRGLTAFRTTPDFQLAEELVAAEAEYVKGKGWRLRKVAMRTMRGMEPPLLRHEPEMMLAIKDKPEDLLRAQRAPEEMDLSELNDQIRRIRRYGLSETAYRVERQARFAIPLAALILVLVGAPLSIRPTRSSGMAVGILGAIVVGFVYFIIIAEFISLGKGGLMPAWAAAWSANAVFGAIGSGMFLTLRR